MFEISNQLKEKIEYKIKYLQYLTKIVLFFIFVISLLAEIGIFGHIFLKKGILVSKETSEKYNNYLKNKEELNSKIGIISIDKTLTNEYTNKIIDILDEVKNKKSYKAIVFKFNSGGGSPSASEDLQSYIKDYKNNKEVYGYIESIAASGAYYIASAITPLYANKNSIVGSIGVIMPHYVIDGLAEKIGVKEDALTVGKYKQPVSMFKTLTNEQKNYLNNNLMNVVYDNFLETVLVNRHLNIDKKLFDEKYASGKIFTSSHIDIKNILIDEVITFVELKKIIEEKYPKSEFVNLEIEKETNSILNTNLKNIIEDTLKMFIEKQEQLLK